jgi:hypothetical protein
MSFPMNIAPFVAPAAIDACAARRHEPVPAE